MDVPYFPVEEDDVDRSQNYIDSLKGTLKQAKGLAFDDDEEVSDQWLDEIIQSVFTDGQKATFKIYSESLLKKNKAARADVRSLFINPEISGKDGKNKVKEQSTKHLSIPQDDDDVLRKNSKRSDHKCRQNLSLRSSDSDHRDGEGAVGPCLVQHLGPNDLTILMGIAQTEVLTIFRQNGGLKISRLQSKRKPKEVGVFGVSLQTLLDRDLKKNPSVRVPFFVSTLVSLLENYLEEEGIMRVSGSLSRIKEVVQALETDDNYLLLLQPLLAHDLSGLLKQFLRDLPSPIFTLGWLDAFCKALAITDEMVKLHAYQTLLCTLPDVNRATLQMVLGLLHRIGRKSSSNKMTLDNISMTIGPSLFLFVETRNSSNLGELDNLGRFVGVTNYLLRNFEKIWTVPVLLLNQIRQVNIEKEKKWKKKRSAERRGISDQKKRSADRKAQSNGHAENTFENIFIHSCHPDFPSICLKLTNDMTIGDVLRKFNRYEEPHFACTSSLYERGGSIEHKLLSPASNLSEVLDVNPHAKFYFCRQSPGSTIVHFPQFY